MINCNHETGVLSMNGRCDELFVEMELIVMSLKENAIKSCTNNDDVDIIKKSFESILFRMCKYDTVEEYVKSLEKMEDVSVQDLLKIGGEK